MNNTTEQPLIKRLTSGAMQFLENQVWQQPLPPWLSLKGVLFRMLRTLDLVIRGFREDELRLHASALTYATLVSLVPILALTLALLKGLGYDDQLRILLTENAEQMPQQFHDVLNNLLTAVSQANFAKIGGVGALVLFFTVVQMLSRIERGFNQVWKVRRNRPLLRRITNYISILVVVPLLLLTAIGVTARMKLVPDLQMGGLRLAPFLATWLAFTFLYSALPNTRVRFLPALLSGLVGALLWHFWFRFYITAQPGVTRSNLIYGTLASVPFFLVWLYFSWTMVLIGAKVTFAMQNGETYRPGADNQKVNVPAKTLVALSILRHGVRAFKDQDPPFQIETFTRKVHARRELTEEILGLLCETGLMARVAEDEEGTFVLARDPAQITVGQVLTLVMTEGSPLSELDMPLTLSQERVLLERLVARASEGTSTLLDLEQTSLA